MSSDCSQLGVALFPSYLPFICDRVLPSPYSSKFISAVDVFLDKKNL